MRRHREAEFGHGVAAVGKQALAEGWIGPRLGDHARPVLRHPFLLGEMLELADEVGGLHAALVEGGLDGIGPGLDGGGGLMLMGLVGHGLLPGRQQFRPKV